jgi:LacI family transcriptional regulator
VARALTERGPTIVDVARYAGVSVSTVSRVVRDHPDVRADTRDRVRSAIGALGYRPSPIARALVSGQTRLLALLVSDIANPFYPQLAKSVEDEAKQHNYTMIICSTADRTAETRRYLQRLLRQGLDGVIHASVARDQGTLMTMIGDPRRVVFTNRRPSGRSASYVVSDNRAGAKDLTTHLLASGHRRIGFVAGPPYASNARERLAGFHAAMAEVAGAEPLVAESDFSSERGARAVDLWMDAAARPTALIAINDSVALGVWEALNDRGIHVPADAALAGFDGVRLAASHLFELTTVDQHIDQMGRRAVQILLSQLAGPVEADPIQQILPTQILLRNSTEGWRAKVRQRSQAVR